MLFQLLADSDTSSGSQWVSYVFLGVIVVALIAMIIVNSRRNKKRQQEAENLINAVGPGNKVKTIGGICGIVVEVDDAENTFVLETGSENSGKCYIKFDKQAIYQTDAVAASDKSQTPAPETADENVQVSVDEVFEQNPEPAEQTSEEQDK